MVNVTVRLFESTRPRLEKVSAQFALAQKVVGRAALYFLLNDADDEGMLFALAMGARGDEPTSEFVFTTTVPKRVLDRIDRIAKQTGSTRSKVVRAAIMSCLSFILDNPQSTTAKEMSAALAEAGLHNGALYMDAIYEMDPKVVANLERMKSAVGA